MRKWAGLLGAIMLLLCVPGCGQHERREDNNTAISETNIEESVQMTEEKMMNDVADEELLSAEEIRMNLLVYVNNEYPKDKVIVSVKPTEAIYLGEGDGGYVPINQTEWENAINTATTRLQSIDQKDPWETFEPICVSWIHGEYEDVWQLCEDGSLWGCHDYESDTHTDNYIAPEDAVELVTLLRETYDELALNPIVPEQIEHVIAAELVIDDKSYYLDNSEQLSAITNYLSKSERIRSSRCFWYLLRLTLDNGETIEIALAGDGCDIWHSDGIYWRFENGRAAEILEMFKADGEQGD